MEITWCTVDFKTGTRGSNVFVKESATFSRIIATQTSATLDVLCSSDGAEIVGWDDATDMARTLLLAVDKDSDQIIWGGMSLRRTSDITSPWVKVLLVTIEEYYNRRYVNTPLSWTNADPAQVAVDAIGQITDLPPLTVDAKMTGNPVVSGFYDTSDNKKIGSILSDLTGLAGGIEWTVDLEWVDADHTQVRYVTRVAPRLGTPGGVTATQWTMPGCVTGGEFIEDFGENNGANDTLALSSGEGDSQPRSTRYEATDLLTAYARFERRFTPATSITSTSTLDQYAEADHTRTRLGTSQLTISANLDAAPQVNLDWWMGDDIDVSITSPRFPRRKDSDDGFWQAGLEQRLRTVGWEINLASRSITPKIVEVS